MVQDPSSGSLVGTISQIDAEGRRKFRQYYRALALNKAGAGNARHEGIPSPKTKHRRPCGPGTTGLQQGRCSCVELSRPRIGPGPRGQLETRAAPCAREE